MKARSKVMEVSNKGGILMRGSYSRISRASQSLASLSLSSKIILAAVVLLTASNLKRGQPGNRNHLESNGHFSNVQIQTGTGTGMGMGMGNEQYSSNTSNEYSHGYPYFSRLSETCTRNSGRAIAHDADAEFTSYLNDEISEKQFNFDHHDMPDLQVVGPSFYYLTAPPLGSLPTANQPALSRAWNETYAVVDHESITKRQGGTGIFGDGGLEHDEMISLAMDLDRDGQSHSHAFSTVNYLPPGKYATFSGWLFGNFGHYMHDHVSKIAWLKSQVTEDTIFLLPHHEIHVNVLTMIDERFVKDRVIWIRYGETYAVSVNDVVVNVDGDININVNEDNDNGNGNGNGNVHGVANTRMMDITESSLTVMVPKSNNPFPHGYPQTATAYTEHLRQWLEESHWPPPSKSSSSSLSSLSLWPSSRKSTKSTSTMKLRNEKERNKKELREQLKQEGRIPMDQSSYFETETGIYTDNNGAPNIQGENRGRVVFYTRNVGTPRRKLDVELEKTVIEIIKKAMIKRGHLPENIDDDLIIFSGKDEDGVTTLSMQRQFEIFSSADTAIGPHGSGLTNVIWMDPRCYSDDDGDDRRMRPKVIEFASSKRTKNIQHGSYWGYWFLYGSLPWVDYHQLYYTPESTDTDTFIDPVMFEQVLNEIWGIE